MKIDKDIILKDLCYTDLVYNRIRKKLSVNLDNYEIEKLIMELLKSTPVENIEKKGKNYYFKNTKRGIMLTINSNTTRIITVNRIE